MGEEQNVVIEKEEWVNITLSMPKRFIEFLKEYGEWVGYDDPIEFVGEETRIAIETRIYNLLDDANPVAPWKVSYFKKKYGL